ncbi:uncharacterized protein N7473_008945 [Penicillium subrubescens]|uniref:uncharacterized protein n=1 Tax=Penicillium subrubescens TaxID=1316194 RepID=UPI002545BBB9|nr:uncharacterized protein N7473_008945 [Penicillium subrubescens]KAJ5886271.1 hypothetical protein N7473_008945 [Penicillium subrubescens]
MARTHGYGKFLGLTEPEQRVLLYSILYATHDGRNPVNFEKLASELGYTVVSAKVITAALAATGIDPGRKPYSRRTASASADAVQEITDAGPSNPDASADPAASGPSTTADEGKAPKKPRKVRRTAVPRKHKACEMDEGDKDGKADEDDGAGTAVAEA